MSDKTNLSDEFRLAMVGQRRFGKSFEQYNVACVEYLKNHLGKDIKIYCLDQEKELKEKDTEITLLKERASLLENIIREITKETTMFGLMKWEERNKICLSQIRLKE